MVKTLRKFKEVRDSDLPNEIQILWIETKVKVFQLMLRARTLLLESEILALKEEITLLLLHSEEWIVAKTEE